MRKHQTLISVLMTLPFPRIQAAKMSAGKQDNAAKK
jgi:hypothetical protein